MSNPTPTKVPQIPAVPKNVDPAVKRWLESVKQIIEVREGTRGQDLDRNVTFRDLVAAEVDISKLAIPGAPPPTPPAPDDDDGGDDGGGGVPDPSPIPGPVDPTPVVDVPPTPTGFTADCGVGVVFLSWDDPNDIYGNHACTEIWRSLSPSFAGAVMVGSAPAGFYWDRVDTPDMYYYWIRFKSTTDVCGPYIGPVSGGSAYDILVGQIKDTYLYDDLKSRIDIIDLVDGDKYMPGSVNARMWVVDQKIDEEAQARATAIASTLTRIDDNDESLDILAGSFDQVSAKATSNEQDISGVVTDLNEVRIDVNKNTGEINVQATKTSQISTTVGQHTTTIQQQAQSINGLKGQWTVKIDSQGYVAGFGLASHPLKDGSMTSEFIIRADRFGMVMPGHSEVMPFVVGMVNGKPQVCLTSAAIGDATIGNTHIDDKGLSANHITSGTLRANTKLTIGNFHFVLETLRENDGSYGRIVVYDAQGHARVILGRLGNDFGLQVVDGNGNVQFDADGPRVTIDQGFIEDLYVGGFKATVPDSAFVQSAISIPISYRYAGQSYLSCFNDTAPVLINTLYYDPQGCERCSISVSFSFAGYGTWSVDTLASGYFGGIPEFTAFKLEVQSSPSLSYNSGATIWSNYIALIYLNNLYASPMDPYVPPPVLHSDNFSASFLTSRLICASPSGV